MGNVQELLDLGILMCTVCKTTRVAFTEDHRGLKCATCGRVYPVRDDIPDMLPQDAKISEGPGD